MATPAHVNTTTMSSGGKDVASVTLSHAASGTDRYLLVGVAVNQTSPAQASGVTFNGVALTRLSTQLSGFIRAEYWYLINPDATTADVVVTMASSPMNVAAIASTYQNVHQITPHGTAATNTGTSTGPTATASSATGELVAAVIGWHDTTLSSIGAGQTSRGTSDNGTTEALANISDEAGAASVVMSATIGAANGWAVIAVALKPTEAGGGGQGLGFSDSMLRKIPSRRPRPFAPGNAK